MAVVEDDGLTIAGNANNPAKYSQRTLRWQLEPLQSSCGLKPCEPESDANAITFTVLFFLTGVNRALRMLDASKINYELIEQLVLYIANSLMGREDSLDDNANAILVFLPGFEEIKALFEQLNGSAAITDGKCLILPLHGAVEAADQVSANIGFVWDKKIREKLLKKEILFHNTNKQTNNQTNKGMAREDFTTIETFEKQTNHTAKLKTTL
jgi:hypothetical protein